MNAIKIALMALVMLCGTPAFADSYCADGKGGSRRIYGSEPCPPVNFTGEVLRFRSSDRYDDGQYRRQPVAARRQVQPELPPGYSRAPCDFVDHLKKLAVVKGFPTIVGGVAGALIAGDIGAGVGILAGIFLSPDPGPCYVIIPPGYEKEIMKHASEFANRPIPAEEQVGGTEDQPKQVVQSTAQQRPRTNNVCNVCADQPGRIPVYRKNGELVCRLQSRPPEEGERPACRSAS